jgi:hypothetical protein
LARDRDAAADISKQFEAAWKRRKAGLHRAEHFTALQMNFAWRWSMIRKSGNRFSLGTNAARSPGDHAQNKRDEIMIPSI